MDILHKHNYNITSAISSLVPSGGPVLCRDEMEEWSASEANLFEEALEKYGKDFIDVRQDFVSKHNFHLIFHVLQQFFENCKRNLCIFIFKQILFWFVAKL